MDGPNIKAILEAVPRRIETPRMIITPRAESDYQDIVQALQESWDEQHRWVHWADNYERISSPAFIDGMRALDRDFLNCINYFGVARLKDTNEIGPQVTLYRMNPEAHVGVCGYWTPTKLAGQGLTTEAMAALLRVGFNNYGLHKITADYSEGNEASRRVLEKLGFKWTHSVEGGAKRGNGEPLTAHHYELTDFT